MSVTIDISIDQDTVTAKLESLDTFLTDPALALLAAGYEVKTFVQTYHEEFGERWRGGNYMAGPVSGRWENEVAADWLPPVPVGANEVSIVNNNPTLAHKITGGTITAKNVQFLTIPLIPEAKGIRAAEYEAFTGNKLFPVKGVLAHKGAGDEIVPVYALKRSVTQGPWPGAMPPTEELQGVFDRAFAIELEPILIS